MIETERKTAAKRFAEYWKDKGYEKGESQPFWLSLLRDVLGVEHPEEVIAFENQVHLDHTSFIDGTIDRTHVFIEQKGANKDLRKPIRQSDGSLLTPKEQALRYANSPDIGYSKRPRWIVTCNFHEFLIYDMEYPRNDPESILLKDLPKEYYRLQFLVDAGNANIKREMEISIKAGELVGVLYDEILKQYDDPKKESSLKSLNMLCVRLVFCLYAEDAGIFGSHTAFHDFIKSVADKDIEDVSDELAKLFKVLDTKPEQRSPYLKSKLAAFPYVNGGLFAEENIEIPNFNQNIVDLLLSKASEDFDWSEISPTIFGAVFESTLNPETRRSGGMHYTSIENIHKVIDPLFYDDLQEELAEIKEIKVEKTRNARLEAFRTKLASLTFLDPACGSGNFLTETYLTLRKLENEALALQLHGQMTLETGGIIKVSIGQFYGIEINDFAVTVAKTALWIAESQMMKATEEIVHMNLDFLPLKSYANIIEGNALTLDWESVAPKKKLSYIMGNPPFVGASMMSEKQKNEAVAIFGEIKLSNSIDYVGAWYHLAAKYIQGTDIRVALVSTNSITQGEQVAPLWGKLFNKYNVHIDFAHRTFRWDSEANLKAHVHCVIIGFSVAQNPQPKKIFTGERALIVSNINAYLLGAPNVLISSRSTPLCAVPPMTKGNQPTDGGNLILSEAEKDALIAQDENISICIRRYIGAQDYLNGGGKRYCLWLKGISPMVYYKNKEVMRRLNAVKEMREKSSAAPTRKFAEKPYLFFSSPQTDSTYLIVPRVSSEKRKYIPIGFMTPDIIAADSCSIVPDATLYHFGVLTSNVHMAWMRVVAGRLKSDYRYSGSVVYNNFPWCEPTEEQQAKIEQTAKAILEARQKYPKCSLADLYGEQMYLFPELLQAHRANDRAVMEAYGFWGKLNSESECVAELMKMYQKLTK